MELKKIVGSGFRKCNKSCDIYLVKGGTSAGAILTKTLLWISSVDRDKYKIQFLIFFNFIFLFLFTVGAEIMTDRPMHPFSYVNSSILRFGKISSAP